MFRGLRFWHIMIPQQRYCRSTSAFTQGRVCSSNTCIHLHLGYPHSSLPTHRILESSTNSANDFGSLTAPRPLNRKSLTILAPLIFRA